MTTLIVLFLITIGGQAEYRTTFSTMAECQEVGDYYLEQASYKRWICSSIDINEG